MIEVLQKPRPELNAGQRSIIEELDRIFQHIQSRYGRLRDNSHLSEEYKNLILAFSAVMGQINNAVGSEQALPDEEISNLKTKALNFIFQIEENVSKSN